MSHICARRINAKEFVQMAMNLKRIRKDFKSGKDIRDELDWLTKYLKYIREHFKKPNYEYHSVVLMIRMIVWANTDGKYPDALSLRQVYPETPAKEYSRNFAEFSTRLRNVEAIYGSGQNIRIKYFGRRSTRLFQD